MLPSWVNWVLDLTLFGTLPVIMARGERALACLSLKVFSLKVIHVILLMIHKPELVKWPHPTTEVLGNAISPYVWK